MGPPERPIHSVSTWVRRQPPKVKAFLAVVSGMAALVLLRVIVHDHDNLFVAAKAVHSIRRVRGRVVDGREITVQFAKYGPHVEQIHKGIFKKNLYDNLRSMDINMGHGYEKDTRTCDFLKNDQNGLCFEYAFQYSTLVWCSSDRAQYIGSTSISAIRGKET
ncbi:hypothetical protein F0562_010904 [Nyssa sinensis]|uniref:Uncharacterized protein n=1 Tax=Nyssa sinensis TaxID=561372 RepID=A0A5J5A4Z0_9ASTE|nr:hypothetical protein F0562_010904 [Nyssa sinensis]